MMKPSSFVFTLLILCFLGIAKSERGSGSKTLDSPMELVDGDDEQQERQLRRPGLKMKAPGGQKKKKKKFIKNTKAPKLKAKKESSAAPSGVPSALPSVSVAPSDVPSATPSVSLFPSESPSATPSVSLFPSDSPVSSAEPVCSDVSVVTTNRGPRKCGWVVRNDKCDRQKFYEQCPVSCNACKKVCKDVASFSTIFSGTQDCEWVTQAPRIRCNLLKYDSICPVTCDACEKE